MTTHEHDAYCDAVRQDSEPDYHEQLIVMQEMEAAHENVLRQQGAVAALQNLSLTLSALILRDSVKGDYFFGMHDALEIVRNNLDAVKGGVA
jgi:hypothetical protein